MLNTVFLQCDNELRFYPDPFLGPPKTPPAGFACPPAISRVMSRYRLPHDSVIPWNQHSGSVPEMPPYAICPSHRTGRTSLGTPWSDIGGVTQRTGLSSAHTATTTASGSRISRASSSKKRSNSSRSARSGSWRSESSQALIAAIKQSNDDLQAELGQLKSMVKGTNERLIAMDQGPANYPQLSRSARPQRRLPPMLTTQALQTHQAMTMPRDTARSQLSGALSGARGGLEQRQTLQQKPAECRQTRVVSKRDEDRAKAGTSMPQAGAE